MSKLFVKWCLTDRYFAWDYFRCYWFSHWSQERNPDGTWGERYRSGPMRHEK